MCELCGCVMCEQWVCELCECVAWMLCVLFYGLCWPDHAVDPENSNWGMGTDPNCLTGLSPP